MPELPEVETTRRGIAGALIGKTVAQLEVRNPRLRWPVPDDLAHCLKGRRILDVARRAKYLLVVVEGGAALIHLGMSGSLRILTQPFPAEKHDHIDLVLEDGVRLRYRDPRRFGAWLWVTGDAAAHPLLASLGPEPLSEMFDAAWLQRCCAGRRIPIKQLIMDNHQVVGVGNIYAAESLFRAAIHPLTPAADLPPETLVRLVATIKEVLAEAIALGGSTLRDYVDSDGKAGYFMLNSYVYGREGDTCRVCGEIIRQVRIGQRASCYCPRCQPR
ncbi:bifunctional DNA-formamidopyrimidine glycosylase/DNA-(apurinic or apyrimidinic site) lyase [Chitinilyticum piscinae]|uniref:Formamidopyrimidine-DNA glycosylase n=1 Tax=Chitinilyticum piscinae TaxID=2866724 RepID=A0A8J7K8A3_9NEIS|nr:bifunctional DNA-formamidopyrimidine glycosylase/DNA-(apurinic or apyrimidinic site) lyase [Chitinilyticum piscinae]MBE9609223.1 bifunctional DNA-formamidopyrimidine glycosylase/DNA-(apurinic or apyrimidinic site) lyase [Chitinilyticum piscinae]